MQDLPTLQVKFLSSAEYAAANKTGKTRVLVGSNGKLWMKGEYFGMFRLNDFDLIAPRPEEIRDVLIKGPAAVASYIVKPDDSHPANTWLYACTDKAYALETLPHSMRKNVRRGLREFKIELISADQFLIHGEKAFCDSRQRVGLSDGTKNEFFRRFETRARIPGHVIIGAWKGNTLAAFLFISVIEGWAINEGPFGADAFLSDRPNDALLFWELFRFLHQEQCLGVSAGLSSIQPDGAESGLHMFKTKAGFQARAVHRVFVLHPLLVPIANPLTLKSLKLLLHWKSSNRSLRKATGALASILGEEQGFQCLSQSGS